MKQNYLKTRVLDNLTNAFQLARKLTDITRRAAKEAKSPTEPSSASSSSDANRSVNLGVFDSVDNDMELESSSDLFDSDGAPISDANEHRGGGRGRGRGRGRGGCARGRPRGRGRARGRGRGRARSRSPIVDRSTGIAGRTRSRWRAGTSEVVLSMSSVISDTSDATDDSRDEDYSDESSSESSVDLTGLGVDVASAASSASKPAADSAVNAQASGRMAAAEWTNSDGTGTGTYASLDGKRSCTIDSSEGLSDGSSVFCATVSDDDARPSKRQRLISAPAQQQHSGAVTPSTQIIRSMPPPPAQQQTPSAQIIRSRPPPPAPVAVIRRNATATYRSGYSSLSWRAPARLLAVPQPQPPAVRVSGRYSSSPYTPSPAPASAATGVASDYPVLTELYHKRHRSSQQSSVALRPATVSTVITTSSTTSFYGPPRPRHPITPPPTIGPTPRKVTAVASLCDGVDVRSSTIKAAGRGLFASRRFGVGELITEYGGAVISCAEAKKRRDAGKASHIRTLDSMHTAIDGVDVTLATGNPGASFANDPHRGDGKEKPNRCNAKFVKLEQHQQKGLIPLCIRGGLAATSRIFLKASREILPRDEIFVNYGRGYWKGTGNAEDSNDEDSS